MYANRSSSACCYPEGIGPRAKLGFAMPIRLNHASSLSWRTIFLFGLLTLLLYNSGFERRFMT